jgi:hypothetical protein
MANWHGTARSNYFRVKDRAAFDDWATNLHLTVWEDTEGRVALAALEDDGGWPSMRWSDAHSEHIDVDLYEELAKHLAPNSAAVLMEVGSEKYRYLTGWAHLVTHEGLQHTVGLNDIYSYAGSHECTDAAY